MSEKPTQTESELVDFVRSIDVPAPERLHRRIEALVAEQGPAKRRRAMPSLRLGVAGALVTAVVVVALVLGLSGGGSKLTLHTAVALTQRPATLAAPAQSSHDATALAADVEGVSFPYWEDRFGWHATGERTDHVDGRTVTTVFYAGPRGQWAGYAIVGGEPAPRVSGGVVAKRGGASYRFTVVDGANVVTWQRDGHLCVVVGHGVRRGRLLSLASWQGARAA